MYNGEEWYPFNSTVIIKFSDNMSSYLTGYYRYKTVYRNIQNGWFNVGYSTWSTTIQESYRYEAYVYDSNTGVGETSVKTVNIMPNPESLQANYYNYCSGMTFPVMVTGTTSGNIYGTDTYMYNSSINKAATHMGLVEVGQTRLVCIKIVPCPEGGYISTTRNGITSSSSITANVGFIFVN